MNRAAVLLISSLIAFALAEPAAGDVVYLSLDSFSETLRQDFNLMGSADAAALPNGWRIGTSSVFSSAIAYTNQSAGTTGLDPLTVSSLGGFYNFADGENATSTDRAVGFLSDSTSTGGNKQLILGLFNNTGSTITELHLSYDIEKYRSGIRSADIRLYYSYDSFAWLESTDAAQHFDADPSVVVLNPPASTGKSIALDNLTFPHQGNLYVRWQYSVSSAVNSQALGIDDVQLSVGPPPDLQWDGAPGAMWDASNANWKNSGGGHVAWNDSMPNNASFVDGGAGVGNSVILSSSRRAGRITFDAGSKSYTLTGGSLQLTGAGATGLIARSNALIQSEVQVTSSQTWDVAANLTISAPLTLTAGTALTKKGSGDLVLAGPQSHGANSQLKMTEGTLHLAANVGQTARLTIQGNSNSTNATVILDSDQDLSQLDISVGDAGLQGLNLSSPSSAGAFRSLKIHASDLAAAKSSLYDLIRQARLTPGDGIYDSALSSHPDSALGIAITQGYILVRPSRIGDINLDGQVTISDFIDLSSNFGHTNVTWQEGDLNFDTAVTISDFIDLASNFGRSYAGQTIPVSDTERQTLDAFAAAHGAAVPEPASTLFAVLASLATIRRRRLQFAK